MSRRRATYFEGSNKRLGRQDTWGQGKQFEQGIGYVLPQNLPSSEFKKIMKKWEAKLLSSGFTDIEYRDPEQTGNFNPYFRQNGTSASFVEAYDEHTAQYYNLASEFYERFIEPKDAINRSERDKHPEYNYDKLFRARPATYRYLFYLHMNGVPYRQAKLYLQGEKPKRRHHYNSVKLPHSRVQQSRSVFWLHSHTQKAIAPFYLWLKRNHGIDAMNTYNREMKSELSQRKRRQP